MAVLRTWISFRIFTQSTKPKAHIRVASFVETPFLRAFQPHSDCRRMHLGMLYSSLPVTISGDPGRRLLDISTNAVASAFSVAIFQCRMSETAADSKNNCQKFLTVRSQLTEKTTKSQRIFKSLQQEHRPYFWLAQTHVLCFFLVCVFLFHSFETGSKLWLITFVLFSSFFL